METLDSAGIDVGSRQLSVTLSRDGKLLRRVFANTPSGHQAICRFLCRPGRITRVCVEATGIYGLDLALRLSERDSIELMVANPRAVRRFAQALLERNKTDRIDADVLEQFAARMPLTRWVAPSAAAIRLRAFSRRLSALTVAVAAEKNQLHAASVSRQTPRAIPDDIRRTIGQLEKSIRELRGQALAIIHSDPTLHTRYELALTATGISTVSAIQILGELGWLPADMDARQWVAHAGLDPRHHTSGTSVLKKSGISKHGNRHLRTSLFMPALAARRHDPALRAFADHLIARGKPPIQALVAVMRKLLVALHAMFRKDQPFDSQMLFPSLASYTQP
jgi:transposase